MQGKKKILFSEYLMKMSLYPYIGTYLLFKQFKVIKGTKVI